MSDRVPTNEYGRKPIDYRAPDKTTVEAYEELTYALGKKESDLALAMLATLDDRTVRALIFHCRVLAGGA